MDGTDRGSSDSGSTDGDSSETAESRRRRGRGSRWLECAPGGGAGAEAGGKSNRSSLSIKGELLLGAIRL